MSNEEYNLDRETIVDNLTVFADARADRAKSFAGGDAKIDDTDVRQFFTGLFQAFGTDPDRVATSFDEAERLSEGSDNPLSVYWPGVIAGVMKKPGTNLEDAIQGALQTLASQTEMPEYLLVTDYANVALMNLADDSDTTKFHVGEFPKHVDELMSLSKKEIDPEEDEDESK